MASHLAWSRSQYSSITPRSYITYSPQLVLWPHFLSFPISILFTPATLAASLLLKHVGQACTSGLCAYSSAWVHFLRYPLAGFCTSSRSLLKFTLRWALLWLCVCMLSQVWLFATPWIIAHQAPLSMKYSRQEYWSGLPFSSPGDLPDPGIELTSLVSLELAGGSHWATWEAPPSLAALSTIAAFPPNSFFTFSLFFFLQHLSVQNILCIFVSYVNFVSFGWK